MSKLKLSTTLMISTIILVAAFQCYWITRLYNDEWQGLKRETDVLFRDVVYKLQLQRFRNDTTFFKRDIPDNLFVFDVIDSAKTKFVDSVMMAHADSRERQMIVSVTTERHDSVRGDLVQKNVQSFNMPLPPPGGEPPRLIKYFSGNKLINDSLSFAQIDSAYSKELLKSNITIPFTVQSFSGKAAEGKNKVAEDELTTNFSFVGLSQAHAYRATFENPFAYIISKIKLPILFSLLLIIITVASFVFLYRNLLAQRRLATIKNEFISNITHELKTPIATVNVAIEALRNFNAIDSPGKTKEYLDISASELQRLSLLVDKVLRISMFENTKTELKKETFDLYGLTTEVTEIMKLQFDKVNANVTVTKTGDNFIIEADRLHITSVIYNLLDNALKYKRGAPEIEISLETHKMHVDLKVKDNGIGIPTKYKHRIFDKFFRVPTNDVHNSNGYGLGLSYVNYIVQRHQGFIEVETELGKGSVFTVHIPYKERDVIWFDDKRCIRKVQFPLNKTVKA